MANTVDYFLAELHAAKSKEALKLKPFEDFVLRVINILEACPESFWKCRDALADLARSRAALDYVECELLNGLTTEHYLPQLVLLECDLFSLRLQFLSKSPPSTTISASIEHRMMAMVRGPVQLHRLQQPKAEPLDVFDPERKIVSLGVSALNTGDVVECRAAVDCCEFAVDATAIMLEMRSVPVYSFQWFYDSATLAPKRILFVGSQDMRAELSLLTALNLGSSEAAPYARTLLAHPNHFIRCSALKTMVHLEPESAAADLDAAVHDPHPQVRAAAVELKLQAEKKREGCC